LLVVLSITSFSHWTQLVLSCKYFCNYIWTFSICGVCLYFYQHRKILAGGQTLLSLSWWCEMKQVVGSCVHNLIPDLHSHHTHELDSRLAIKVCASQWRKVTLTTFIIFSLLCCFPLSVEHIYWAVLEFWYINEDFSFAFY
jgi:hypothetical protein